MTLVIGDCRETLARWAAEGVRAQCVVTSPPYWGLRDYGTASWSGGDPACDHRQGRPGAGRADGIVDARGQRNRDGVGSMGGDCGKCGARRIDQQLGLEPTPEEYVARMVEVFRLVRDVLADDGVAWLNLGDSYNAYNGNRGPSPSHSAAADPARPSLPAGLVAPGLKPKDLVGIPWRVAFALQADGWWLRSDIIWAKPNPMPESVTDRPTKAHEYLFLLTKTDRYFYDAEAIKEPTVMKAQRRLTAQPRRNGQHAVDAWTEPRLLRDEPAADGGDRRNKRSVWTIATQPYPDAHFATFPEQLVQPCILAGSRPGDTILDPFMGSGTVAKVAQDLGRKWLGCELNAAYARLVAQRTGAVIRVPMRRAVAASSAGVGVS